MSDTTDSTSELALQFDRWHPRNCFCSDCEAEIIQAGSAPIQLLAEQRARVELSYQADRRELKRVFADR